MKLQAHEESLSKLSEQNQVLQIDNDKMKDAASFFTSTKLALEYKIKSQEKENKALKADKEKQ